MILGQYDEELGEYEIADGLTKDDYIAYPQKISKREWQRPKTEKKLLSQIM